MIKLNEVLVLEKAPVIKERFEVLGSDIDEYLKELDLKNVEVNEDNLSLIKKKRTELRKVHKEIDDRRKDVRKAILEPYDDFKDTYDEYVGLKLTEADKELKTKIDEVEEQIISDKTVQFVEYFEDKKAELDLNWTNFDMVDTKINLSSTIKSTTDDIDEFFNKIQEDLIVWENLNEEQKPRIMAMYRETLNMAQSIMTVQAQMKAEAEVESSQDIKKKQIEKGQIEDDTIYSMTFTVKGTKKELGQVKKFLLDNKMEFK